MVKDSNIPFLFFFAFTFTFTLLLFSLSLAQIDLNNLGLGTLCEPALRIQGLHTLLDPLWMASVIVKIFILYYKYLIGLEYTTLNMIFSVTEF